MPEMPFYPDTPEIASFSPLGFFGSVPLAMENPCPPTPLLLASRVLLLKDQQSDVQRESEVERARAMSRNYVGEFGHLMYFSSDMCCGSPVKLVHATGFAKHRLWWRFLS